MHKPQKPLDAALNRASSPLVSSAYNVMASTALTAVLGLGFWALSARLFDPDEVGNNSAIVAALVTVSAICQLNLSNSLLRFLPKLDRKPRVVACAYGLAIAASIIGGLLFTGFVPWLTDDLDDLALPGWAPVVFVCSLAIWAVFVLQDAALTALRKAHWLPVENSSFGIGKLILVAIFGALGFRLGIFYAWILPLLVIIPLVNYLLFKRVIPAAPPVPVGTPAVPVVDRGLRRFLIEDYVSTVFGQATITLLPLLVLAALGSEQTAYFYIAFTLVTSFDLLLYGATVSLTAEASHDLENAPALTRTVLRRFVGPSAIVSLLMVAAAPLLLLPFGELYSDEATNVLRLLALASTPRAILFTYMAVCRIRGDSHLLLAVESVLLALIVPGVILLASAHGLDGVGIAWLVPNALVAVAVLPLLLAYTRLDSRR